MTLRKNRNLTLILITHDLRVAAKITDRLVFLYKGRIVESGNTRDIVNFPLHPYSKLLFSVVRSTDIEHNFGNEYDPVSNNGNSIFKTGCSYYPDCPIRDKNCLIRIPHLKMHKSNGYVACHQVAELKDCVPEN